jgi:hypothetical protein
MMVSSVGVGLVLGVIVAVFVVRANAENDLP